MAANITKVLYGKQGRGRVGRSRSDIGVRLVYRYQNHISVLNVLIPLLHVATSVATSNRGPILCKRDFGLGFAKEASTRRHHCKFRHTAERRAPAPALRASPCNHSNLDISANSPKLRKPPSSAWSCRSRQPHSRQQRPRNFRLRPQSQRIALSSALPAALTISKRPARSRRRPFGVPSPCGKNGQENCRFPWDWQLRRPPASPPAAGKRARSRHPARAPAHAHARAQQPPSLLPIHPPLP